MYEFWKQHNIHLTWLIQSFETREELFVTAKANVMC